MGRACDMCMGTDCAGACAHGDCYWEHEERRMESEQQAAYEAAEQERYEEEMQREDLEQQQEEYYRAMGGDRGIADEFKARGI
jgi:hypothetical protein